MLLRNLIHQAAVATEAEAVHELLQIIPWKRPPRRTSRSTYRSPSEASSGDRILHSLIFLADCQGLQPVQTSFRLLSHQGIAASPFDQKACRKRISKCVAGSSVALRLVARFATTSWVQCLPHAPRLRPHFFFVDFDAPSQPYLWPGQLPCTQLYAVPCAVCQCRHFALCTALRSLRRIAAVASMPSRREKRQDRQSRRPGSLNRRFTDDTSQADAELEDPAILTPAAHAVPSDEPYKLTQKEVALLNYINWKGRTGKPPPLTVFAEPSLQKVLRSLRQKQRQPLPTQEEDVQVVKDVIHVSDHPPAMDTSATATKTKQGPKTKRGLLSRALRAPGPREPSSQRLSPQMPPWKRCPA